MTAAGDRVSPADLDRMLSERGVLDRFRAARPEVERDPQTTIEYWNRRCPGACGSWIPRHRERCGVCTIEGSS